MPPGEPGPALGAKADEGRSELFRTLGIVALAVLMGLTSWVIASVSTWMVPAYVTAMVLIFATPRAPHGPVEHSTTSFLKQPDAPTSIAEGAGPRAIRSSAPIRTLASPTSHVTVLPVGSSGTERRRRDHMLPHGCGQVGSPFAEDSTDESPAFLSDRS